MESFHVVSATKWRIIGKALSSYLVSLGWLVIGASALIDKDYPNLAVQYPNLKWLGAGLGFLGAAAKGTQILFDLLHVKQANNTDTTEANP